jgi:hypothetical protein
MKGSPLDMENMKQSEVAAKASEELGFKVTEPNLKKAAEYAGRRLRTRGAGKQPCNCDEFKNLLVDVIYAGVFKKKFVEETLEMLERQKPFDEDIYDAVKSAETKG